MGDSVRSLISEGIGWALHCVCAQSKDVGVDYGRPDVGVDKDLLNRPLAAEAPRILAGGKRERAQPPEQMRDHFGAPEGRRKSENAVLVASSDAPPGLEKQNQPKSGGCALRACHRLMSGAPPALNPPHMPTFFRASGR
jgi:hypothetical protein